MSEPTLADFYLDSLLRRAGDFAPDPDNKAQVYRLARHLFTGWLIFDDGVKQKRWSDYTPEEKAARREHARELALEAKAKREAAQVVRA